MDDPTASILRVAAEYRARLDRLEADTARAVGAARRRAEQRLRDELGRFLAETQRVGIPERVTRKWITDLAAYQRLEAAARAGMDEITREAVRAIQWRIAEAAHLGEPAASDLTAATLGPQGQPLAATGAFGKVHVGAVQNLIGQLQASSPLANLPNIGADAVRKMTSELVRGMVNGEHSRTIARRIARTTDIPAQRAATIARTEIHRAYREANRLAYQANPMVDQWRWQAGLGARTCSACWAMHGTIHPVTEAMGSHPNCRCTMLPVVSSDKYAALGLDPPPADAWPTGEDLFAQQPKAVQREVLGPGKYDAYQRGKISLNDTVAIRRSAQWGTTRTTATIRDALGAA